MAQKIVALVGRKQSGKTSSANFICGYVYLKAGKIKGFNINEEGELIVNAHFPTENGFEESTGILDVTRRDYLFGSWAIEHLWPYANIYFFADKLKEIAVDLFGLEPRQVYGTNEEKNTLTKITWKSMCSFLPPRVIKKIKDEGKYTEFMTGREFLQYFGTNVCRVLFQDCFASYTINHIRMEQSDLAVISDCRFDNEIEYVRKNGGKIIVLGRRIDEDGHDSEPEIADIDESLIDLYIDNQNMTMQEKNQIILDNLFKWGYVAG